MQAEKGPKEDQHEQALGLELEQQRSERDTHAKKKRYRALETQDKELWKAYVLCLASSSSLTLRETRTRILVGTLRTPGAKWIRCENRQQV